MASVKPRTTTRKDGTTTTHYEIRWRDPDGQNRSETHRTKRQATRRKTEIEHQLDTGRYTNPADGRIPLNEYVDEWWKTKIGLKPKTDDSYRGIIRREILPTFGNTPLNRITPIAIEQWLAAMHTNGASTSRCRQSFTLLHQILEHAARHQTIPRNPAHGIKPPGTQPKKLPRYLTRPQLDRLIDKTPDRYQTLIAILGYTGIRWAEAVGLQRRHVNMLKRQLHIETTLSEVNGHFHSVPPKTHQEREVLMPQFLTDRLAAHMARYVDPDPDALVFTLGGGQAIRGPNFRRRVWLPACERAAVELTVHELRHTAASLMLDLGWPIVTVSKTLGHSSISVTVDRYGHLYRESQEALVALFDDAGDAGLG